MFTTFEKKVFDKIKNVEKKIQKIQSENLLSRLMRKKTEVSVNFG